MPIEIFELVVKATINEGDRPSGDVSSNSGNSNNTAADKKVTKQEIDEQILELMKRKNER